MEQPRIPWTICLCVAFLMFLQFRCTVCVRNTTHCSPTCKEVLPCSSLGGCEVSSDPCLSNPCPNNATCQVTLDTETYECHCPAGFKGRHCDIPMRRCHRNHCRHGGECYETDRGPTCFCAVGYKGTFCESPEDECLWNPCQNGAVCRHRGNGQACYCVPGFQGALCNIEVDECVSDPCQHGGTCLNQIGRYTCVCLPEYSGVRCEQDVNRCESDPCKNGGTCENLHGGYTCHCLLTNDSAGYYYGGPNCMERLIGCEENTCQNGGSCVPYLLDGKHFHACSCPAGFFGLYCQTRTTFSFNGNFIPNRNITLQPQRGSFGNISLSFRTVQTSAVIISMGDEATLLRLYLQKGFLFLALYSDTQLKTLLYLSHNVSDDHWHTVEIIFTDNILLTLNDPYCGIKCQNQSTNDGQPRAPFRNLLLGGDMSSRAREGNTFHNGPQSESLFVGCLQDIRVGSIVITEDYGKLGNIEVGCHRRDYCESNPCENKGRCINLWLTYHCDCYRPYRGNNCSTEYEAAFFGHRNVISYASFQTKIKHSDTITISALVRTYHDSGMLFALGNSTACDITVSLDAGKLTARNSSNIISKGDLGISDGRFHLVSLKLTQDTLELFVLSSSKDVISMDVTKRQIISALYVGGLENSSETIERGGYYKGCVQDLRIGDTALEFFPINKSVPNGNSVVINVTRGCTNDSLCESSPCQDGGVCGDTYYCPCPNHTVARKCDDWEWCHLTHCPSGSVCQPVPSGYECVSTALFNKEDNGITFRGNGNITRDLTNLTIGFRTLESDSVLLHAQRDPEVLTVGIWKKQLYFHLQSGNGLNVVNLLSVESVSDSRWYTVTLSMSAPGSQLSTWQMEIDGKPKRIVSSLATGNLNFLREGTDIYLGADSNGIKGKFTGCLGTVLIEGIHLPYFSASDYVKVKPQIEQFVKLSSERINIGCLVSDPCGSHPCMFGGSCHDVFTQPVCTCPPWRTGTFCETDLSDCLLNPCLHGNCTAVSSGHTCECEAGYTGTNCDIVSCHDHLCVNGATCVGDATGYICLCPLNFTGQDCSLYSPSETSALSLVRIFSQLPSAFCGNEKKNITCYNFSNCTEVNGVLGCSCYPGFTGERCETDIDECASYPCLNGGICQNLPNRFHCICDVNFAGDICEIDLSEFLPPGVFTAVASTVLALFFAVCAGLCIFIAVAGMRSSQGTYSPSRQEKEGSRVEMWNIVHPPPLERLI